MQTNRYLLQTGTYWQCNRTVTYCNQVLTANATALMYFVKNTFRVYENCLNIISCRSVQCQISLKNMCTYYSDSLVNNCKSPNCNISSQKSYLLCTISRLSNLVHVNTLLGALPSIQPTLCAAQQYPHTGTVSCLENSDRLRVQHNSRPQTMHSSTQPHRRYPFESPVYVETHAHTHTRQREMQMYWAYKMAARLCEVCD